MQKQFLKLVKLKNEGRLTKDDIIEDSRLGVCFVVSIDSINTITVKNVDGKYYRISGLVIGSDTRIVKN